MCRRTWTCGHPPTRARSRAASPEPSSEPHRGTPAIRLRALRARWHHPLRVIRPPGQVRRAGHHIQVGPHPGQRGDLSLRPLTTPAAPVMPYAIAPCHSTVNASPNRPLPKTTESTNTIAAVATPGSRANCHGLRRAHLTARLARPRTRTPAPATANRPTAPADIALPAAICPVARCRRRSAPVTTAPVATAAPHGTSLIAPAETVIWSRRVRFGSSLRSGVDMVTPVLD